MQRDLFSDHAEAAAAGPRLYRRRCGDRTVESIRRAVWTADPAAMLTNVSTVEDALDESAYAPEVSSRTITL